MKTCTKCGETKDFSEFGKDKYTKDGYKRLCRRCERESVNKLKESPVMQLEKAVRSSVLVENKLLFKEGKRLCGTCRNIFLIVELKKGYCTECLLANVRNYNKKNKEKIKEYLEKNKEKRKEQQKEYHKKNKEKIIERSRNYYEKNKEEIKDRNSKYYEKNKDKISEKNKEYLEENKEYFKEYFKEYRKENKEKIKEYMEEYQKKYREKNREKIKERQRQYRLKLKEGK